MRLTEILTEQRILIDSSGASTRDKGSSLQQLGRLMSSAVGLDEAEVFHLLNEREKLQSTGIGDGVAIPHASTDSVSMQVAALVICPSGIDFQAIDGAPVSLIFGLIGPRRATGEHLKTLARISRLFRDASNRSRLLACREAAVAFKLILEQDSAF